MEQRTPVIDMQEVESSQIHSIGHHAETGTMAIRFRDRRTSLATSLYHYSNVPVADFEALRDAESKGSHFGKHIKPYDKKYPYVKVEGAPAAV
ncbi:KTSC domain-containing protein [Cupriavidus sp. DL-D2]|uniref:KTSC domain-containing protein n=1 Tax=Cupriavidus sp. DL-D2 TaxID=3144974 RepID=UPI0032146358